MPLDTKAFNDIRTKFNERVREYAIQSGEHSAFTMANYIAFAFLRPYRQSDFITDEGLAAKLNMSVSTIRRLRRKLVPLGLVVTLGTWKGNATEYAIGPGKGATDDTLSTAGKPTTGDTLCSAKPLTGDCESLPPVHSKPVTGERSSTRRSTRRRQDRESAQARAPLSAPPADSQISKSKNQVAEEVPSQADVEFGLSKGLSIDAINREAEKYRERKPDMPFRLWLLRAIEYEERRPKARPEGVGLTGFMGGLKAALAKREAKQ